MASINAMLFDISNSYLKDSLLNVQFPFWGQVLVKYALPQEWPKYNICITIISFYNI